MYLRVVITTQTNYTYTYFGKEKELMKKIVNIVRICILIIPVSHLNWEEEEASSKVKYIHKYVVGMVFASGKSQFLKCNSSHVHMYMYTMGAWCG